MYRLSSASEGALGKLEIRWRSQLGDSGRLQTQQILAAPTLSRDASLAAVSLPVVRTGAQGGFAAALHPVANMPTCKPLLSMCRHAGGLRRASAAACTEAPSAAGRKIRFEWCRQVAVAGINHLARWQSVPVERPFPLRLRVQSRVSASFRRLHLCAPAPAAAAAPGGAPPAVVLQVPAAHWVLHAA